MQAVSGKTVVEWSVSSSDAQTQRVSLRQGGQEVVLQPTSPYHSALRIVGPDRTLPIQGGYFEIPLPAKLFEGNPTQIKLSWIDFYRN